MSFQIGTKVQCYETKLLLCRDAHRALARFVGGQVNLSPFLRLREKDVQLDVQVPASAAVALPAPVLSILLNNLVANAFQYTETGVIGIAWQGSALEIRDSGPGIEEDIVERLGEPLVKGSTSTGFGLGLSIVKRLCDRFDVVLSIGPLEDGGTRAEVRFPA